MTPIWSDTHGWSRSLGPYLFYGFVFALAVSAARFFADDFLMGGNALAALPSLVVGPAVGLCAWAAILFRDRLRDAGAHRPRHQVAERDKRLP